MQGAGSDGGGVFFFFFYFFLSNMSDRKSRGKSLFYRGSGNADRDFLYEVEEEKFERAQCVWVLMNGSHL